MGLDRQTLGRHKILELASLHKGHLDVTLVGEALYQLTLPTTTPNCVAKPTWVVLEFCSIASNN